MAKGDADTTTIPAPVGGPSEEAQRRMDAPRLKKAEDYAKFLGDRLNLTADQIAEINEIIARDGSMEAEIGPAGSVIFIPPPGSAGNTKGEEADEKIANVLTPAQQQNYDTFRRDRSAARTEKNVTRSVDSLRQRLELTPEQAEQTKTLLTRLATDYQGRTTREMNIERQKVRTEAMRTILTPEQFERFQPPRPPEQKADK